jgi:hypothetical protein
MYASFNTTVRGAHFCFLPFGPPQRAQLAADNVTLSTFGEAAYARYEEWATTGSAYYELQSTKASRLLSVYDALAYSVSF